MRQRVLNFIFAIILVSLLGISTNMKRFGDDHGGHSQFWVGLAAGNLLDGRGFFSERAGTNVDITPVPATGGSSVIVTTTTVITRLDCAIWTIADFADVGDTSDICVMESTGTADSTATTACINIDEDTVAGDVIRFVGNVQVLSTTRNLQVGFNNTTDGGVGGSGNFQCAVHWRP